LQKAYINARYKEDYQVNDEELLTLTGKIKRLHEIASEAGSAFIKASLPLVPV